MSRTEQIQLFEGLKVRTVWDDEQEKWFFSVADSVQVLTDSVNPADYIKKMLLRGKNINFAAKLVLFLSGDWFCHCWHARMRTINPAK